MTDLAIVDKHGTPLNQQVVVELFGNRVALTFASRSGTTRNSDYARALDRVLEIFAARNGSLIAATIESLIEALPNPADRNIVTVQIKPFSLVGLNLADLRKQLTNQRHPGNDGSPNSSRAGAWKKARFEFEFQDADVASTAVDALGRSGAVSPRLGAPEGALTTIVVNRYERSPANRSAAIAHHGTACAVCELDFAARYREVGAGFIHIHHVVPISQLGTDYVINPATDLAPVCPNCHAMLHRGRGDEPRSIEELRAMLR